MVGSCGPYGNLNGNTRVLSFAVVVFLLAIRVVRDALQIRNLSVSNSSGACRRIYGGVRKSRVGGIGRVPVLRSSLALVGGLTWPVVQAAKTTKGLVL